MSCPRVRFAPSPTGELHVGNARTALFNWLFARRHGGQVVLRIEDTDPDRSSPLYEAHLLLDLQWLGLNWDEGPYRQSERLPLYRHYLDSLIEKGLVYPCYCTEEELEAERKSLLRRGLTPRYGGRCRSLTAEERGIREAEGRLPAWRFKVPPGPIRFHDIMRGDMQFLGESIGDFIIVRRNGTPAYNFACVIDDHLMNITHVIRGEDHLTNTASQMLLYQALNFEPPLFAHHALILGQDRTKLSKRHGDVTVAEFRRRGILPQALINYLALLGSSLEGKGEVSSLDELVGRFSLERVGRGGAVFDEGKLIWLNTLYLRREPVENIIPHLRAIMEENQVRGERVEEIFLLVRENISTLRDVLTYLKAFNDETFELTLEAKKLLTENKSKEIIRAAIEGLKDMPDQGGDIFSQVYKLLMEKTGLGGKDILMPLRAALTGKKAGPELDKVFSFLGKKRVLDRLQKAIILS